MAKEYQFNWMVSVPDNLREGDSFDMWEEETGNLIDSNCLVQVDEYGFYLSWSVDGKETQVIDLTQVFEAKPATTPKDSKIASDLESRYSDKQESIEDRSILVSSGVDLVNVTYYRLVAKDSNTARTWRRDLNSILHNTKIAHVCPMTCLRKHWKMLCLSVNERRKIPAKSVTRTFASGKTEKLVHKCLIDLGLCGARDDEIEPNMFTFENFYDLYLKICPRTDVQEAFSQLSGGADFLGVDCLIAFLNDKQRDPRLNEILFPFFNKVRVEQLIDKYEPDKNLKEKGRLSVEGFLRYLMSDENAPVFLDRVDRSQDLDQPLCHYLVNSSHNTYLIGRQFGGRSSVEMYRQVLISGCRCIELDIWDGKGTGIDEPIITHGKAMCTDIPFKDVIYAIRDTAFMTTDLPVILSFENHCSKSNQLKMAQYCEEILGDLLLTQPLDSHPLEPAVPLPSPNQLRSKILIKNKRLKPDVEAQQLTQYFNEGKVEGEEEEVPEDPNAVIGEDGPLESVVPCANSKRSVCHASAVSNYEDEESSSSGDESHQSQASATPKITSIPPLPKQVLHVQRSSSKLLKPCASSSALGELAPPTSLVDNDAHPELRQGPTTFIIKSKLKMLTKKKEPPKEKEKVKVENNEEDDIDSTLKLNLTKEEEEQLMSVYHYTGATTNIHPLLSAMVNYTHPIKFIGFDVAESNNCHFHMSSFSESTGLGLMKQSALEFVNYNKRQMSRIYPKGGRVDSSNFLPQIFWNVGVQMVALNFQTPDLALQLNQGKFEYNGCCGYLLKPDFMRRTDRMFDPFSELPVDGVIAAYCSVRVISGQFLSDRKIGTYVEVEMYGLPTDTIRKEFRTRIVPSNGLNPFYNEEPFVFRKVVLPELAVLRFAVYDENGKLLGQRILPLDGLQAGYRHVSLRSESNFPMTLPTLFCNLIIKTYVPEGFNNLVDALADPKAFLKSQKAAEAMRQKQLEAMGIKQDEIGEVPQKRDSKMEKQGSEGQVSNGPQSNRQDSSHSLMNSVNNQSSSGDSPVNRTPTSARLESQSSCAAVSGSDSARLKLQPINIEDLKKDKQYLKLLKKHSKESEDHNKKHQKEQVAMQKNQQQSIDKIMTEGGKGGGNKKSNKSSSIDLSVPVSPSGDSNHTGASEGKIHQVVSDHTDDWSKLMKRHLDERHKLATQQCHSAFYLLKNLLKDGLDSQTKHLKNIMDEESKELKANQTKNSMGASKKIQQDKGIKTKAEKDRRVKELNEKNLKIFMEERKRLGMKQGKTEDQLKKQHIEQMEVMEKIFKKELETIESLQKEEILAVKPQTVV